MTFAELLERISKWENLHTEFKQMPVQVDDLAAEIVAFANTDGGQLIIGVQEKDRIIVGVSDQEDLSRKVDNVAYQNCEPPVTVVQEVFADPNAPQFQVLVINIPKGDQRPYRTNKGIYFVRTSTGKRQASREELLRLFQSSGSIFYDETPFPRATLTDLDFYAFEAFLKDSGQSDLQIEKENLLRNWRLVQNDHPTLSGLLLFGRLPQQFLPFAHIEAIRFPGTDTSLEPRDRKSLTGRILDQIDQVQRFLLLHLRNSHEIKGFEPENRPELPEEIFREAIVNAVAHRDYTITGPIRVFILDDRVEIHTPGKPPNTVDEAAMRSGVHVVRNPHIYSRLADAGLVTRAGSGIRRIIRLLRETIDEDLILRITEFETLLIVPRPAN